MHTKFSRFESCFFLIRTVNRLDIDSLLLKHRHLSKTWWTYFLSNAFSKVRHCQNSRNSVEFRVKACWESIAHYQCCQSSVQVFLHDYLTESVRAKVGMPSMTSDAVITTWIIFRHRFCKHVTYFCHMGFIGIEFG